MAWMYLTFSILRKNILTSKVSRWWKKYFFANEKKIAEKPIIYLGFITGLMYLVLFLKRKSSKVFTIHCSKKMTPGVNFTNILHTAFKHVDPKSVKKIDNLTVFFSPFSNLHAKKAVSRTVMKLSNVVNLINI